MAFGNIDNTFMNMLADGHAPFALKAASQGCLVAALHQALSLVERVRIVARGGRLFIRGRHYAGDHKPPAVLCGY